MHVWSVYACRPSFADSFARTFIQPPIHSFIHSSISILAIPTGYPQEEPDVVVIVAAVLGLAVGISFMGVFDVIGDTILYCLALEMLLGGSRFKSLCKDVRRVPLTFIFSSSLEFDIFF